MRMLETKVIEIQNVHPMFSNPPPLENDAVYDIMRKNMVDPDRPRMTI
jgi:hypothetical protein